jgi:hypothetical protein
MTILGICKDIMSRRQPARNKVRVVKPAQSPAEKKSHLLNEQAG